jgi:hypothetical protein
MAATQSVIGDVVDRVMAEGRKLSHELFQWYRTIHISCQTWLVIEVADNRVYGFELSMPAACAQLYLKGTPVKREWRLFPEGLGNGDYSLLASFEHAPELYRFFQWSAFALAHRALTRPVFGVMAVEDLIELSKSETTNFVKSAGKG